MSRFEDNEYEPVVDKRGRTINTTGLWEANVQRALAGKRGQAALRDLRDALLALPTKRLIEGALCTVRVRERVEAMPLQIEREVRDHYRDESGQIQWTEPHPAMVKNYERDEVIEWLEDQGEELVEGVCAVGAYVWWQKVKAGVDPEAAFDATPIAHQGSWDTIDAGQAAGLTYALASTLAFRNDEHLAGVTPEVRYTKFVAWLDKQIVL